VFTARYALSPYIKQIRFVFKGLRESKSRRSWSSCCIITRVQETQIFVRGHVLVCKHFCLSTTDSGILTEYTITVVISDKWELERHGIKLSRCIGCRPTVRTGWWSNWGRPRQICQNTTSLRNFLYPVTSSLSGPSTFLSTPHCQWSFLNVRSPISSLYEKTAKMILTDDKKRNDFCPVSHIFANKPLQQRWCHSTSKHLAEETNRFVYLRRKRDSRHAILLNSCGAGRGPAVSTS
jgi:hypothetical protein